MRQVMIRAFRMQQFIANQNHARCLFHMPVLDLLPWSRRLGSR